MAEKPATDLQPGDRVILAFTTRTVDHIYVEGGTIEDDGFNFESRRWPGVTVYWVEGGSARYRLKTTVDVE
jgi:hypothetical protein